MYTDMMVDIETTGSHIDNNAVIQIAIVPFNLATRAVSSEVFNRCLSIAPNRYWDEDTRKWWSKQPEVFRSIAERMENAEKVMHDMVDWVRKIDNESGGQGIHFWGKPISFDFPFVASYCRQYGLEMPFHYRIARDLNSYIAGLRGSAEHPDMSHVEFEGPEHDGLWDAFHQIKILFDAQDSHIKAEVM